MSVQDPSKRLSALLKKLRAAYPDAAAPQPELIDANDAVLDQLVFSLLLWESSSTQAKAAMRRLREAFVDFNELRVCLADEVVRVMGDRVPLALERSHRLHAALMNIFNRQHECGLTHLLDAGKREAKAYLESVDGLPSFAAARVLLLTLGGHAIPCDERLRDLLAEAGVCDALATPDDAAGWLERHVPADEAQSVYALFQAWSDDKGHPPRRERRPSLPTAEVEPERPQPRAAKPKAVSRKPGKTKARGGG